MKVRPAHYLKSISNVFASEYVVLVINLNTSFDQIGSTKMNSANGIAVKSFGKDSVLFAVEDKSLSVRTIYYTSLRNVELISCNRLDEEGETMSFAKSHCS